MKSQEQFELKKQRALQDQADQIAKKLYDEGKSVQEVFETRKRYGRTLDKESRDYLQLMIVRIYKHYVAFNS